MPRPRRLSASSNTSSDPDIDRANAPRRRPSAPPVPTAERPSRASGTRWRPPNPRTPTRTQPNISRLQAFQRMPREAQMRVLYLSLRGGMSVTDAIDSAVSERRLGLNIVRRLIQRREEQAAELRVTLERVNENVFTQWIVLTVLVQGLPAAKQVTGRQMLRMVSVDPRDIQCIAKAQNAVVGMGRGHDLLKRTLDTLYGLATSFHKHEESLRGLQRYDRYQPILDADPIEGPPGGVSAPTVILEHEEYLKECCQLMQKKLSQYCAEMDQWMHSIMFMFAYHQRQQDGFKQLHELAVGWNGNVVGEERERQVLQAPIDQSRWDDPTTDDQPSILLGAVFKCSLASPGRPSRELLSRLSSWELWNTDKPAAVATEASETLKDMWDAASTHWDTLRLVLSCDIKESGLSPAMQRPWLDSMVSEDMSSFQDVALASERDGWPWPIPVKKRMFTMIMMYCAKELLGRLYIATDFVAKGLSRLGEPLPTPRQVPQPLSTLYSRAMHHSYLLRHRSLFQTYHRNAVQQFRALVEQSCRNPRAKKLMLAAMPASGHGADLEQVRNIAMAAHLQQKSILDSATALSQGQTDLAKLSSHIKTTGLKHTHYLSSLPLKEAEALLSAYTDRNPSSLRGEALPDALLNDSYSRPFFTPAAPGGPSDPVDLAGRLTHSTWRVPVAATIQLLHRINNTPLFSSSSSPSSPLPSIATADARRLTSLALTALFHLTAAAAIPAVTAQRDSARALLSRHAWLHGLHAAWLAWQRDAAQLAGALRSSLAASGVLRVCVAAGRDRDRVA
ncbi:hypothetical protein DIS24_g12444, partial [Lasiodiplodia hormozganensis]